MGEGEGGGVFMGLGHLKIRTRCYYTFLAIIEHLVTFAEPLL
jgi:hypothetical protein